MGFSGDLVPAKAVMTAIRDRLNAAPVGYIGVALAEVISKVSREEYSKLGVEDKGELQLMLAGPLSPIPQVKAENVSMFSVGLFQLDSPYFEMKQLELVARLGYAREFSETSADRIRKDFISPGLSKETVGFQNVVVTWTLADSLVAIGGEEVGECFIAGSIDLEGPKWQEYGDKNRVHVKIQHGRFVLCDSEKGTEYLLKTIFEYDPKKPDADEIVFGSPFKH